MSARTESAPPTTENASWFAATASRDGLRALGERAATRRRPSARSRRSSAHPRSARRSASASRARCRARASRRAARRTRRRRDCGVPRELRGGHDVDRQLDLEVERDSRPAAPRPSCRRSARCRPGRRGCSSTPSLSSTFAPPEMSTNGRSTSPSRRPRCSSSARSSRPAYAGSRCATASVEACARCAEPNASLT